MAWLPKDKIVVPIDFSDTSLAALGAAIDLVADASHLHVIHVLAVLEPAEPGVIWNTVDDKSRAHHAELAVREKMSDPTWKSLHVKIAFGDPGHEIADYAQALKADLIVIPSHGRRGLSRLLLGSVAERVVRLAHCPVLVLKQ
jgi:nucleotide-binding universal stress UspA family protein